MKKLSSDPRLNAQNVRDLTAILAANAAVFDTILPADREDGALWYDRARAAIADAAALAGAPYNRVARVIAHLSIMTDWDDQLESLPAVSAIVAARLAGSLTPSETAAALTPYTLYDHTTVPAAAYADYDDAPADYPKKTRQFYRAFMLPGDHSSYVIDSHDLQLRGMLQRGRGGALTKHRRLDAVMKSKPVYERLLADARARLARPCARQAERWTFWRNVARHQLRAGTHPALVAEEVECPISPETPMVLWRIR